MIRGIDPRQLETHQTVSEYHMICKHHHQQQPNKILCLKDFWESFFLENLLNGQRRIPEFIGEAN